jgi:hypothetical protein
VDDAVQAVVERVRAEASHWFPGIPPNPDVHLRPLGARRRSRLYAVSLGDAAAPPLMIAKVRNENTAVAGGPGRPRRPILAAAAVGEAELTECEFAALRQLEAVFAGQDDPRFGAVRALAHLPAHHTILMGLAPGVPLRDLLTRWSRLRPGRRREEPAPDAVFRAVGAWLRRFHDATPTTGHPVRQGTGEEVVAHFQALEEFLGRRLGRRFGRLAGAGSDLARQLLPSGVLPLAVGHGDFAPRNVMCDRAGRIVVLDPLARWAVPEQEDLCRFLVGVQLNGLQVHTRGAAHAADTLARWQDEVLKGYYGQGAPLGAVRCYQLLVTLDKWSALVEPALHDGVKATLRTISQDAASGYVRAQAERLVALARSADS